VGGAGGASQRISTDKPTNPTATATAPYTSRVFNGRLLDDRERG